LKAEELARVKAEEEARQKADEEARAKAEEEAKLKAEQEARLKAEEEARAKAEEEARLKAEEEEEARLKAEEEARAKAEEEARQKAVEEARLKAEEEARLKAEQEAKLKAEEEARAKAEEEARQKAEEEAQARAEEEARLRAEEEARAKAEEETRLKAEEEAKSKAEKEARLKAEEEARAQAEEEAKQKAKEEAKAKAEEEARLKAEEDARVQEEARAKDEIPADLRPAEDEDDGRLDDVEIPQVARCMYCDKSGPSYERFGNVYCSQDHAEAFLEEGELSEDLREMVRLCESDNARIALGLPCGTVLTESAIKQAFKKSRMYHPDKYNTEGDTKKLVVQSIFQQIGKAKEKLLQIWMEYNEAERAAEMLDSIGATGMEDDNEFEPLDWVIKNVLNKNGSLMLNCLREPRPRPRCAHDFYEELEEKAKDEQIEVEFECFDAVDTTDAAPDFRWLLYAGPPEHLPRFKSLVRDKWNKDIEERELAQEAEDSDQESAFSEDAEENRLHEGEDEEEPQPER